MQKEEKIRTVLKELIRVQLACCTPVYFVPSTPIPKDFSPVINGTMTFAKVDSSIIGISCAHVYRGYEEMRKNDPGTTAWIKNLQIAPEEILINIDDKEDIAIFRFQEELLHENGIQPTETVSLPFRKQEEKERVLMSGFPGAWKRPSPSDSGRISWKPFHAFLLSGAPGIIDTRTQIDRSFVRSIEGFEDVPPNSNLGGCSGGPVFLVSTEGILHWRLVGVFTESSSDYEIIVFNSLQRLDSNPAPK